MDAKFQQLSQQIETLIRTTARAKGVEVGDNSAASIQRINKAGEQLEVRFGGRNNKNNFGIDDNNGGRGIVPRYTKLDFPIYDGSEDPLIWLHRCDKFFSNQHMNNQEKVGLAAFHMVGEAQLWVYQLEQEEPNLTWGVFKEYCTLRFDPPMKRNPLGELINLKQTSSVEDYQRNFQKMLARATSVRTDQQADMFTAGLVDLICLDVELHNPSNLVQAMSLARAFEKKIQISSSTQRGYGSTSNISAKAATTPVTLSVKVGASNPFVKKLTSAEMAARRAKGLCYNCDDPYVQGHQCKKLLWLEVEDGESREVPTDRGEPAI
ncbi:hypothetical protein KY285_000863 [Solanum tuberosum]|nr:hypothetical protein KY285_000863 [Solanum tuberosum]